MDDPNYSKSGRHAKLFFFLERLIFVTQTCGIAIEQISILIMSGLHNTNCIRKIVEQVKLPTLQLG